MKRERYRAVRVARLTILLPREATIEKQEDLDKLLEGSHSGTEERRSDALLVIKYRGARYSVIIEDTGVPEPKDLERLADMEARLRAMQVIPPDSIVVKHVHHTGIRRGKTLLKNMARSYRVELSECSTRLDLAAILDRIA